MKKNLILLLSFVVIYACQTEQPGDENYKSKELTETGVANDISEIRATLSGYANPTPDMGQVEMGILYSIDSSPSLENGTELKSVELDGNNMYKVTAVNLSPGTTYYYKSFVRYGGVYRYGNVKNFKTLDVKASIVTSSVTDIGETKATLNGKLTIETKEDLTKKAWILYSDTESTIEALKSDGRKLEAKLQSDGTYSVNVTGLLYGVDYNYVSIADVQGVEIVEASVRSFSTKDVQVTISTEEPTNVEFTVASLSGKLTVVSEENLSKKVFFLYSTSASTIEALKTSGEKVEAKLNNDGTISYHFDSRIYPLSLDTKYYYAAVATVNNRDYYASNVKSFKTYSFKVSLDDATEVGTIRASLHGRIETDYKAEFREIKAFFSLAPNTEANISDDGTVSLTVSNLEYLKEYQYYLQIDLLQNGASYRDTYKSKSETLKTQFNYNAQPVDMGLSVKWADRNLGAATSDDFGGYFKWGETEPFLASPHDDYKWYNSTQKKFTKYTVGGDNLSILEPEDDAATVNMGYGWRMPTAAEVQELCDTYNDSANYKWELVSQQYGEFSYQKCDVWKVTYLKNGNYLFFPPGGYRSDSYGTVYCNDKWGSGYYWSSSLGEYTGEAVSLSLYKIYPYVYYYTPRTQKGYLIRPVYK